MTDRAAHLAGIAANPDCDLPRLVYADWLDERGDPNDRAHAAFIRLSCNRDSTKKRQTKAEGKFLEANWKALVPAAAADGFELHRRNGRITHLNKEVEFVIRDMRHGGRDISAALNQWLILEFWRGFVRSIMVYRLSEFPGLISAAINQPVVSSFQIENAFALSREWTGIWSNCVPQPVFKLIKGYSIPDSNDAVRTFTRSANEPDFGHLDRARRALSDAIRDYIVATPPSG